MPKYDFTDLVLLVGTNPLPNYVVAKYFLQKNNALKNIWLVHSEKNSDANQQGTEELVKNIKNLLCQKISDKSKHQVNVFSVALSNITSASKIEKNIKDRLIEKLTENGRRNLHLNYTGGTKTMAVHVYRTLEREPAGNCSFSYLDARDFKLKNDDPNIGIMPGGDLREEIDISLKDLLTLHGCKIYKAKKGKCNEKKLEKFKNALRTSENSEKFQKIKVEEKIDGLSLEEYGFCLEQYVYKVLENKIKLDEHLKNKNIPIEINWGAKNKSDKEMKTFEIDVILINGYQVCGISCTTSKNDNKCKKKGFEILHRVRQVGGEESKAVLLTCMSSEQVNRMDEDLKLISGSDDKLKIIGWDSLEEDELWEELRAYIWGDE